MNTMIRKAMIAILGVLLCTSLIVTAYAANTSSDEAAWDIYRIDGAAWDIYRIDGDPNVGYDGADVPQANGIVWTPGGLTEVADETKDIYLINGSEPVGIDGDPPNGIVWDPGDQSDSASTEPYNPDGDYQADDTPAPHTDDIYPDANGKFKSIEWLAANWQVFGYPDYVGGVYSTDGIGGNLTVLLTDDNEATRAQVLASLVDATGVSFGTAKYSHNTMLKIHDEILADYFKGGDNNVYGIWIGWTYLDGVLMGFGDSGYEFRVVVSVEKTVAAEYAEVWGSRYGDMVVVEAVDARERPELAIGEDMGAIVPGGEIYLEGMLVGSPIPYPGLVNVTPISARANNLQLALLIAGLALAVIGTLLFVFRARFIPALQTNTGDVVTGDAPLSKEQTVAAIKDSAVTPPDGTFNSIMEKIEKTEKPQD